MPYTPHVEQHFTAGLVVRDSVIGMSDGLTVPFALAAGLTGAIDSTTLVVTAGLAEIAAGSIAMGLGGYLAGKSDVEHYATERAREQLEIEQKPEIEAAEVLELLQSHGLTAEESAPVVEALRKRPEAWRDFMLRFELGLEKPDPRRALTSAVVIASAYVVGGLIPLGPYMALSRASAALPWSIAVTGTALAVFGWVKGRFTGARPARSALQTFLIGGLAAAAAFLIARAHSKLLLWLDGWRGKRPREARTRPSGVGAPHPEESMPQSTRRSDALSARSSGDSATWNPADMASLSH